MEGIVGGSGYALSGLEREFQAAVVHHQFEDRFRVDIRRVTPRTARPQSADVTPAEHARMGTAVPLCSSATRLGHRSPTTLSNFAGIVGKSAGDTCRGRWEVCRR